MSPLFFSLLLLLKIILEVSVNLYSGDFVGIIELTSLIPRLWYLDPDIYFTYISILR